MAQTYLNKKQELFCKFVAGGATKAEAYELAGYEPSSANACGLANKPLIQKRIEELKIENEKQRADFAVIAKQAKAAGDSLSPEAAAMIEEKCEWTFQRIMDLMGQNVRFAQVAGEYRAANECLRMMGDALNMFEDAKAEKNAQGNRSPAQNTLALIGEVTNILAGAGGGGGSQEPNALRPRLASTRAAEPV